VIRPDLVIQRRHGKTHFYEIGTRW
jgi:hypothetical protein